MNTRESSPKRFPISDQELYDRIAAKACELYQRRGDVHASNSGHGLKFR